MAQQAHEGAETDAEMSITEARERLTKLPEQMRRRKWHSLAITRRGKPVLAVMPWELYESIRETMEILGDQQAMARLRRSLEEIAAGRTHTSAEARDKLGL